MDRFEKFFSIVALFLTFYGVWMYAQHNLGYLGLWWDETAQFWISQGLSHYAEPGAVPQGIVAVLKFNREQNLDPGGFSTLQHLWTKWGTNIEWVRSLPFLFFLILQLCMGALCWKISKSWLMTIVGLSLPLAYPGVLYFGMENRAYAMEMAGVACAVVFLAYTIKANSRAWFLLLGTLCAFFMTARYSYVFTISAIFCTLLYGVPKSTKGEIVKYGKNLAIFSAPIFIVGGIIFWYVLRSQIWPEMTNTNYFRISVPDYTQASVLASNENMVALIAKNIFSVTALPISLSIFYYLFVQGPVYRLLLARHADLRFGYTNSWLFIFVLTVQVITIFASFVGVYPWDIDTRWNAYLLAVSMIGVIALLGEVRMIWQAYERAYPERSKYYNQKIRIIAVIAGLVFCGANTIQAMTYSQSSSSPWTDLSKQIDQYQIIKKPPGKIFVTRYDIPVIRYLYEHGPFKGGALYPNNFRFETDQEWREQGPVEFLDNEIGYIISGTPISELQRRFPHNKLVEHITEQNSLIIITNQAPKLN